MRLPIRSSFLVQLEMETTDPSVLGITPPLRNLKDLAGLAP
jgi:propanediol utilization protein